MPEMGRTGIGMSCEDAGGAFRGRNVTNPTRLALVVTPTRRNLNAPIGVVVVGEVECAQRDFMLSFLNAPPTLLPDEIPDASLARPARPVLLVLAAILLIGFGLRLTNLGARSIWYDEGFSLAVAGDAPDSLCLCNPDLYDEPPMITAMGAFGVKSAEMAGLQRGFWPFDAWLKLASVAFSLLAVFIAWAAFRRLFRDEFAALLGAALCAASPFQVYYAQELRAYAPYVCFSAMLLYCAVRAVEGNRARWWAGVSAAMVLMLYTHYFSVWNIALFNCYFVGLIVLGRRELFRPWIISQVVAFILVLPSLALMYHANAVYSNVTNIFTILPTITHGFLSVKAFLAGYSPRNLVYWPLFLGGMCLYLAGLWQLRRRPSALVLVIMLSLVPVFANVLVWRMRTFPMYEHRLFIFSGLVYCGVVGLGLSSLRPRLARWAGPVFLFALMAPCLWDYYHQNLHPSMDHRMGVRYKVDSRSAAQYVAASARPGDIVGHASHLTYFPMGYYLEGKALEQHCLRLSEGELSGFLGAMPKRTMWDHFGATPKLLPEVAAKGPRLWYVESWWEPWSIPPMVLDYRRWLESHGRTVERKQFDGLSVTLFELKGAAGQP